MTFPAFDYGWLYEASQGKKTCLEFGPGSTTWCLLHAGLERIVTCEYQQQWLDHMKMVFFNQPKVTIVPYFNGYPIACVPTLSPEDTFDIAVVDSPKQDYGRPLELDAGRIGTMRCALQYTQIVHVHDATTLPTIAALGKLREEGHTVIHGIGNGQSMATIFRKDYTGPFGRGLAGTAPPPSHD